ncbi:GH32 C-terminal domain-containing protein [Ammoniphilus sp. YIM 78166]|uniref:glycoside hydrolase family 32 protein n=1 Tax=Ammoniphilus sp. YIM 78166 TaxID=1644106 RepID=UPI0014309562|nr:GH32 C-terminal domain-containing protein [Ammoniphilus sp. YIM 78166]
MNKLEKANDFILKHKEKVTNRPYYHFTPEIGWMNDPNGFSFYRGKYHLFYQYYPYDVVWNDMHWGHATTQDFIQWGYQPVALANDKIYDANGCFSGSAIEKEGKLYLMYTGHIDPNIGFDRDEAQVVERQCLAFSEDGICFEKYEHNPVIGEKELPNEYLICDFRDPKVTKVEDVYYCVLSVRNKQRRGEIILFKSSNLLDWTFHASIYQSKFEENTLLECPDLFRIGNKDVLIFSEMPCDPEFQKEVDHKTVYVVGEMDYQRGIFKAESKGLLDYGHTFYAPQSTEGKNGERLLIGWMHRWHQTAPPRDYGFNGMMSLPRRLALKDHQLIQQPVLDLNHYFHPSIVHEGTILNANERLEWTGEAGYLRLDIDPSDSKPFTVELHKSETKSTRIEVDVESGRIFMTSDYGNPGQINLEDCFAAEDENLTLEFFIDLHSVELFVNAGEKVASFAAYDRDKGSQVSILGKGQTVFRRIKWAEFKPIKARSAEHE